MSILRKDYEISVWKDTWESDKFVEERLGIIGSNSMSYEGRAIEPNFSRNVNGVKKLSFKMYKYFVDPVTGEKVLNPFVNWLVSERKVKLKYEKYINQEGKEVDRWYDFIVKNIIENSENYLYTYELEDALVQELSKNGFGMTLDMKFRNNMGSANYLAATVLAETDWSVHPDSEVFVEKVNEALIYVTIDPSKLPQSSSIVHIIDQDANDRRNGVTFDEVGVDFNKPFTALAFYSSCTGKPHYFQFIYHEKLNGGVGELSVYEDDKRTIAEANCQYYIEIDDPAIYSNIIKNEDNKEVDIHYFLPPGVSLSSKQEDEESEVGTTLSYKYRGDRYGFAQQSEYIPVLDRYCNKYQKDGEIYYGYLNANYKSPALITNLISGSALDSTHGWTGSRDSQDEDKDKATVESVYGYFSTDNNNKKVKFINSIEELSKGEFRPTTTVTLEDGTEIEVPRYHNYIKIHFPNDSSCVINSCIYDNRTLIGNIFTSDQWALKYCAYKETIDDNKNIEITENPSLNFKLGECKYNSSFDSYVSVEGAGLIFGDFEEKENGYYIASMEHTKECSEKDFKNTQARLIIKGEPGATYYIESISLFKAIFSGNTLITPEEQAENIEDRTIDKTYYYFLSSDLSNTKNADELEPSFTTKSLDYTVFKPVYNDGAEKIRSVTAKESNYFNILQSIAETNEAWLILEVERDAAGGITNKYVKFKNYIGKDNYAGFHYGVNLKNIQRTYESKNIVTKLMVKANSNEYANNGFCTIQRANANPTGESYIYDFQYYFNKGLLKARDYLETVYIWDGASGPDITEGTVYNLQAYFPRIKALNEKIESKNEILINIAKDLVRYNAKLEIASAGLEAATSGIEQTRDDFRALTKTELTLGTDKLEDKLLARTDVQKLLNEYAVYSSEELRYTTEKNDAEDNFKSVQATYDALKAEIDSLKEHKIALNQLFFTNYSRFIQEGTWIDEEYIDDEKYYADALSVMYNSCYPQVAYQINVLELSKLPGYEMFEFQLGDKTTVEDPEFFGENVKEEVIITELKENLDDPSKNIIKVQNFKNQFQDLFQKITATVQQAQYRTGSYEKAVALAEATSERKNQFLTDALDAANSRLTNAGQQSVTWGADGITVQDVDSPSDMIRMVGGAILLSKQDKNGEQKWVTGVTSDGVSASLITAGVVNTSEISIMSYDEPVFRWDQHGISAFDYTTTQVEGTPVISGVDSKKFVRFDKHGIYGINGKEDGLNWVPKNGDEIDDKATFALTWDGLKVSNSRNIELHIGDGAKTNSGNNNLLDIRAKESKDPIFAIKEDGSLVWSDSSSPTRALYARTKLDKPVDGYDWAEAPGINSDAEIDVWHRIISPDDKYASYTYNGGVQWSDAIVIRGDDGETGKGIGEVIEYYALSDDSENAPEEWTPNKILQPTQDLPYLWNYEVAKYDDNDNTIAYQSDPIIIAYYTEDGDDGRGIVSIQNYYLINSGSTPGKPITTEDYSAVPEDGPKSGCWYTTAPKTTITDEYLWNCEIITYSKEPTTVTTDPAVIGTHGASPYTISLDEDFISVQAENDGTVASGAFPSTTITPTAYYGSISQTFTEDATNGLGLFITATGLDGSWNGSTKKYTVTAFSDAVDRGTVEFTLKKDNVAVAHAVFEAVKQKAGLPGTPGTPGTNGTNGQYVYALCDYDELKIGSFPTQLTILMQKRSGSGSPTNYTGTIYYKISIDGANFPSENGAQASLSNGQFTVLNSSYSNATKSIRINICSDQACTTYIDKLTISVLKDGEEGEGVYILYHDATDSTPSTPNQKDFNLFPTTKGSEAADEGWYTKQTNDSVYMTQKHCKASAQANTAWEGVTRISGTLSTYDDLWNALDEKSKEDNAYGGIYTIKDGDNKYIGVKADFIKTGALSVGNHPKFKTDGTVENLNGNILYADIEKEKVLLAGWEVTASQISQTTGTYYTRLCKAAQPSDDVLHVWEHGKGATFSLLADGTIKATKGLIDQWSIGSGGLYYGNANNPSLYLGTSGLEMTIDGIEKNVVFKAGSNFGVTKDGTLYASNAEISGIIEAFEGNISDFRIDSVGLRSMSGDDSYCGLIGPTNDFLRYNGKKIVFYAGPPTRTQTMAIPFTMKFDKRGIDTPGLMVYTVWSTVLNFDPAAMGTSDTVVEEWAAKVKPDLTINGNEDIKYGEGCSILEGNQIQNIAKSYSIYWENKTSGRLIFKVDFATEQDWNTAYWNRYFGVSTYADYQQLIRNTIKGWNYSISRKIQVPVKLPSLMITEEGKIIGGFNGPYNLYVEGEESQGMIGVVYFGGNYGFGNFNVDVSRLNASAHLVYKDNNGEYQKIQANQYLAPAVFYGGDGIQGYAVLDTRDNYLFLSAFPNSYFLNILPSFYWYT